jgi:hypothetical protein
MGIPKTIMSKPRCVTTSNMVSENTDNWDWYCSGEPLERWRGAIRTAVSLLLGEAAEIVMTQGVLTSESRIHHEDQRETLRLGLEGERQYREYCDTRWKEIEALMKAETDPQKKMDLEVERTGLKESCSYVKPSIEMYEKMIPELQAKLDRVGWFTEEERARYRGWLMWQETRCARIVLESKARETLGGTAEEAKKDFECHSIQIRDFLNYGKDGVPEGVLRERAARDLAPEPPKLTWEAKLQDTSDKTQDARDKLQETRGKAPGSDCLPEKSGGGQEGGTDNAGAAALAGAVALLGALLLSRLRAVSSEW